ncbi:hypothetical protein [Natronorarus salvus]|uniref:hypothetical protein n=1 Tax=Natronorarus salvus TaxID=3117733 RepID=UPI002F26418B
MVRDVKQDLIDFLHAEFPFSEVSVTFTEEDIDFPDYDGGLSYPSIRPATKDTTVPGSGVTGFTGIDPGGAGPTQNPVTTVQVDCWGGTTQTGRIQEADVHPGTVATELAELVRETCRNNATDVEGYQFVGTTEASEAHDSDRSPTVYREFVIVAMGYHERPAAD